MKSRSPLFALLLGLIFLITSCNRYLTPYEAANGKAKWGRSVR